MKWGHKNVRIIKCKRSSKAELHQRFIPKILKFHFFKENKSRRVRTSEAYDRVWPWNILSGHHWPVWTKISNKNASDSRILKTNPGLDGGRRPSTDCPQVHPSSWMMDEIFSLTVEFGRETIIILQRRTEVNGGQDGPSTLETDLDHDT